MGQQSRADHRYAWHDDRDRQTPRRHHRWLPDRGRHVPAHARATARRGAARVTIAPIHLPDWAVMASPAWGRSCCGARGRSARRGVSRPSPVMVVGHSMGGIIARLAMAPEPLDGRRPAWLPTSAAWSRWARPTTCEPDIPWRHAGQRATEHLERVSPGAWFAPTTGYLTVGSTMVPPSRRAPTSALGHARSIASCGVSSAKTPAAPATGSSAATAAGLTVRATSSSTTSSTGPSTAPGTAMPWPSSAGGRPPSRSGGER